VWLSGLVVSALGIWTRGPGFDSWVVPLFHWVATLGMLFTELPPQFLSSKKLGYKKGVFGSWVVMVIKCAILSTTHDRDNQSKLSFRAHYNIQIVTGIEVNSESNFPQLQEYCPSAKGTRAIFPQLREIRLTIDRWWQSLFVLLYLWSKWQIGSTRCQSGN